MSEFEQFILQYRTISVFEQSRKTFYLQTRINDANVYANVAWGKKKVLNHPFQGMKRTKNRPSRFEANFKKVRIVSLFVAKSSATTHSLIKFGGL
jgi:hypothetical protein